MPVGTQATVKGVYAGRGARDRRRHRARQHLPPDAAARRRARRRARRPAQVHELAAADPDRLRRLPGDVAVASCARSTSAASRSARISTAPWSSSRPSARSRSRRCSAPTSRCSSTSASSCRRSRGRDRARDAAVAALGGALQARVRERSAQGPRAVRHRAGRRRPGAARGERAGARPTSDFHGYAIGGLAVGEPQEVMLRGRRGRRRRCCRRTGRAT